MKERAGAIGRVPKAVSRRKKLEKWTGGGNEDLGKDW